jgi:hypothetical protein
VEVGGEIVETPNVIRFFSNEVANLGWQRGERFYCDAKPLSAPFISPGARRTPIDEDHRNQLPAVKHTVLVRWRYGEIALVIAQQVRIKGRQQADAALGALVSESDASGESSRPMPPTLSSVSSVSSAARLLLQSAEGPTRRPGRAARLGHTLWAAPASST